jgi:hypothetical protein
MPFLDKLKMVLPVAVFSGVMIGPRFYVLVVVVVVSAIGVSNSR